MRCSRAFATHVAEAIVDQSGDEHVDHAVVALATLETRDHQPQMTEQRELMTDGGHRLAEAVSEVADAQLAMREGVQEPEPQRVREREKHVDSLSGGGLRREPVTQPLDRLRVFDIG